MDVDLSVTSAWICKSEPSSPLAFAAALGRRDDEATLIKGELLVIKWMMGFVLAFQVAIFAKLFMG